MHKVSNCYTFAADLTFSSAVHYLELACKNTFFSAEIPDSPIQVMSLLEAANMSFDKIFIMNSNQGNLPSIPSPHPFLPTMLQTDCDMPFSSLNREIDFFERILERFKKRCGEIIYSYSSQSESGPLQPSYFVNGERLVVSTTGMTHIEYEDCLLGAVPVVEVKDKAVRYNSKANVAGGVSILKKQMECPFKSFADHRLKNEEFPIIYQGLPPKVRGAVLRDVMARLWRDLRSQSDLLALSYKAEQEFIDTKIQDSIQKFKDLNLAPIELLNFEKDSMLETITSWLKIEKTRPPFMVEVIDRMRYLELGGLVFRVNVHREDVLEDSFNSFVKRVPIDYRVGEIDKQLTPVGFRNPKLPMSILAIDQAGPEDVVGVAYAYLKKNKLQLSGISVEVDIGKEVTPSSKLDSSSSETISETKKLWHSKLEEIAYSYVEGKAEVKPSAKACSCCNNKLLCRSSVN